MAVSARIKHTLQPVKRFLVVVMVVVVPSAVGVVVKAIEILAEETFTTVIEFVAVVVAAAVNVALAVTIVLPRGSTMAMAQPLGATRKSNRRQKRP